jgi:DNA-binding GntR family transcriptional regulator
LIIMGIDRGAEDWPYRQMASMLRAAIVSGQITGRLPSVGRLAQEYELSPKTVRHGLEVLAAEGFIRTVPRRGSFVRPRADWPQD